MNEFSTTDIALATTLLLIGYPLQRLDVNGRLGTFVFSDKAKKEERAFDFGEIMVDPRKFHNELKRLTTLVKKNIHG